MPVSKNKRTKKTGQRPHAGRFAISQQLAMRLMGLAFLLMAILLLGASTISDPVQALVKEASTEFMHKDTALPMRAALLRHTAAEPDDVRDLDQNELMILFGKPTLIRHEGPVTTWQFASGECALDIYFRDRAEKPVYAEYRVRGSAEGPDVSQARFDHRSCVRSLFIKVPPI